jgi:hypothetical protein
MPNLISKYLFPESIFLLPPLSFRAILSIRGNVGIGTPPPLAVAQDLAEEFRRHFESLQSNKAEIARFGWTSEDLDLYKLGFLAPLIIIRISSEEEARPGIREILLMSIQHWWGYDEQYSSFIGSKIDMCTQLRKQAKWKAIFQLASSYNISDSFNVGIAASEEAFQRVFAPNSSP